MTKEARKNLIRTRYLALFGVAISGLMPVSAVEIAQEARTLKRHTVSDSVVDEEIEGVTSTLQFDSANVRADRESEILLTKQEKERVTLAVDMARWSKGRNRGMWLVVV